MYSAATLDRQLIFFSSSVIHISALLQKEVISFLLLQKKEFALLFTIELEQPVVANEKPHWERIFYSLLSDLPKDITAKCGH